MNILLVGRNWPLEKRGAIIFGSTPEGEPPTTRKKYGQWQRGPKVRSCFQELIFRGFRVTVEVSEKDYPDLHKKIGALKSLGAVEEIISPNKARFSQAGVLRIQIRVVDETEKGIPPLTPDEKRQVCDIEDVLGGRRVEVHLAGVPRGGQASRKTKDKRPLPTPDDRQKYTNKIKELLPVEHSDRAIAKKVIEWAGDRGDQNPTSFGRWRILDNSTLEKEAGKLRKEWAEKLPKRRKR